MIGPPAVRYARASGADIAFQQFGDGDVDVVFIHPMAQNIELAWERPEFSRMFNRFGTFSRVLHFDKRGTGASDRTLAIPTLDERVDDIRAVMDAAGVDRAVMYGVSEGGPMAILFAVSYPQRVTSLILQATSACFFPVARFDEERTARLADLLQGADVWGTEQSTLLHMFGAEAADDPAYRAWQPRYERQSATPRAIAELLSMLEEIDVTPLLADITVPTLVVHRLGDTALPVAHAQSLAAGIPGARLVVVDGEAHFPHVGDTAAWLDAVEEFVTGLPPAPSRPTTAATPRPYAEIRTLGGFAVRRGGHDVPSSAWGSRQARQLCKRLAAAAGNPVPREQLIDMLWPDEATPLARLGARLSVQLSAVRRVLGGGVTADRTSIRIDPDVVHLDLVTFDAAAREHDDATIVATYRGGFLPEDPYDGWTM